MDSLYRIALFSISLGMVGIQSPGIAKETADPSSLYGKVMVGYQGWFNCEGDGVGLGWKHWSKNARKPFGPGNVTVDLWPDMSEYSEGERYKTGFQLPGGKPAEVFSSANRKTVLRHFRWMQEYGIDGAFLKRFANGLVNTKLRNHKDTVLSHVREGTKLSGRTYAVMYDLSGLQSGQVARVLDDWTRLSQKDKIIEDPTYLHHKGKPLVAIWGIGFSDDRSTPPMNVSNSSRASRLPAVP